MAHQMGGRGLFGRKLTINHGSEATRQGCSPPSRPSHLLEVGHERRFDIPNRIPIHAIKEGMAFDFLRRVPAQPDIGGTNHPAVSGLLNGGLQSVSWYGVPSNKVFTLP